MDDTPDVSKDNPSTPAGRPGEYHVGGGSSGGFGSRADARRASGDEIGAQMEEVGMDSNFWLDRAIATMGMALGLPPNPKNVKPETMFSVGGMVPRVGAELFGRAARLADENQIPVVADYPGVASNPPGSPVGRKAAVERVGHHGGGGKRPSDDGETLADVASSGGGQKKILPRRHRIGGGGRGTSTVLTGPLGTVGGARVERHRLLGS